MKKLSIIMLALAMALVFALPAMADTSLGTSEVRPTIDTYKVTKLTLDAGASIVTIDYALGYVSGTFQKVNGETVEISDRGITRGRRFIVKPAAFGTLPADYQASPVTKVLAEINGGTFGGEANLLAYLEVILNSLTGL